MRWAYTNLETFPYPPDLHIIAYNHLCLPLHLNVFDCAVFAPYKHIAFICQ